MKPCLRCGGTGQYLGNGMMLADCDCSEVLQKAIDSAEVEIDRKSKHYKEAINKLMKLHKNMSRAEAVALFDKTYESA